MTALLILGIAAVEKQLQASAQQQQQTHVSLTNNYRITNLPDDWVVQDINPSKLESRQLALSNIHNFEQIAIICREEEAIRTYSVECLQSTGSADSSTAANPSYITIDRFNNLQQRPEVINATITRGHNKSITPTDVLALFLDLQKEVTLTVLSEGDVAYSIESQQPTTVNVTKTSTSLEALPTTTTVPASLVGYSSSVTNLGFLSLNSKTFALCFVDPTQNTGYVIYSPGWPIQTQQLPPDILQIMQSFELVASSS